MTKSYLNFMKFYLHHNNTSILLFNVRLMSIEIMKPTLTLYRLFIHLLIFSILDTLYCTVPELLYHVYELTDKISSFFESDNISGI